MNTHRMSPIGHLIELGNGLIFVVRGREEREKKKKKKENITVLLPTGGPSGENLPWQSSLG